MTTSEFEISCMENPDFMIHIMRSHDAIQLYATSCLQQIASCGQTFSSYFSNIRLTAKLKFPVGTANKSCLDLSTLYFHCL